MMAIKRSALFRRQLFNITVHYRDAAGKKTALKFVDQIEDSIIFITANPFACPVYTVLENHEFRKWRIRDFPVSIFFRIEGENILILEALYAHRMNIAARLPKETRLRDQ